VSTVGGEASRDLRTLGDGAVSGDHDIDVPGGLIQPLECLSVGVQLTGAATVEHRDQDVGGHVAGEQVAPVGEQDRGVATACASCSTISPGTPPPSAGSGVTSAISSRGMPDALPAAIVLRPLSGLIGSVCAGGGGVARHVTSRHVTEPGVPQQVVPVRMGGEPDDDRHAELVKVIGELVQLGTVDAGIDQDQPTVAAHHDAVAPDPRALSDPDALGHLIQHRFTVSVIPVRHNDAIEESRHLPR